MILRALILALVLLTALLVQTVMGPALAIAGVVPDLVLLSTLLVGVQHGPGTGLRYGFVAGLASDLLAPGEAILGTGALVALLVGYAAGVARPYIAGNELLGQTVVAVAGTVVGVLGGALLRIVLGVGGLDALGVLLDALGSGLYALVLAPPLALVIGRVGRGMPADPAA